jgi:hypothetical protein
MSTRKCSLEAAELLPLSDITVQCIAAAAMFTNNGTRHLRETVIAMTVLLTNRAVTLNPCITAEC